MDNANRADADRPDNRSGSPLADSIASPIAITVAICTYNGANRLPEVLDALERQQLPEALKPNLEETGPNWEVLVVDNNSTDATRDVVARSEEHTSELQSLTNLVCRLLLEKKKKTKNIKNKKETHTHSKHQ